MRQTRTSCDRTEKLILLRFTAVRHLLAANECGNDAFQPNVWYPSFVPSTVIQTGTQFTMCMWRIMLKSLKHPKPKQLQLNASPHHVDEFWLDLVKLESIDYRESVEVHGHARVTYFSGSALHRSVPSAHGHHRSRHLRSTCKTLAERETCL